MTRALAGMALIALVPPLAVALAGGADLDLPGGARVSWYEALGPALAGLGALLVWLSRPPAGSLWRGLRLLAVLQLLVVAAVCWTGGLETSWISVTDPVRPASIGLALLAVSASRGLRGTGALRRGRQLVATAALGIGALGLLVGAVAADRDDLHRRVESALARDSSPRPDVIFLLADTLRADALGTHGAEPSPSPALDALAAQSVVFRRAIAQAPWTLPSVFSLMTSKHPSTLDPVQRGAPGAANLTRTLPEGVPALVPTLRAGGYHTVGFQKNPWLGLGSGMERGFDVYESVGGDAAEHHSAAQLVDAALAWARTFAAERREGAHTPFFLYLHFMDPHAGYQPPPAFVPAEAREYEGPVDGSARSLHRVTRDPGGPSAEDVAQLRALYRGEVAYLDSEAARLRGELEQLGLWGEDTVVVLIADHGEQFGEHERFEHRDVHVENVHVPFFLRVPGVAPRVVESVVRLLDVTPTLLELVGIPLVEGLEGRSLVPALHGEHLPPVLAVTEFGADLRVTGERLSVLRREGRLALYDLLDDPGEARELGEIRREEGRVLRALLEEREDRAARAAARPAREPPARVVDEDTRRALEALGYLRGDPR